MRRLRESPLLQGGVSTKFVSFDFPYHGSKRDDSVAAKVDLSNPTAPRVQHPAIDLTTWTSAEVLRQVHLLKGNGEANTPLIGIGHSMGSSALWNIEVQHPGTFDGLILFEPVYGDLNVDSITDFLVPSREAAEEHLHNLKNFAAWDRESLTAYMKGALVEEPSGEIALACSPPIEASLYCHKLLLFDEQQLAQPKCKIYFHSGARTKMFLPPIFESMAEKWPHLYAVGEPIPRCSHAMVMEKPEVVSEKILGNLNELESFRQEPSTPTSPSKSRL
ncbi:hypothetical protein BBJ28_00012191 [Nothophytophthora sp. Chile5]|nr:hypothetical protein BBJ28_00012191 [Nothophytophthora sp. Chile5]